MDIKPWPDIQQYGVPGGSENGPKNGERGVALIRWGYSQLQEEISYERDRAEAALARLRVAVEALQAADENFKHDRRTVGMIRVKEALDEIGPIP